MTMLIACPPGPPEPPESTYSSVNTRIAPTHTSTETSIIGPRTPGTVTDQKRRQRPAPSIAAASCSSRPTFPSAARYTTM